MVKRKRNELEKSVIRSLVAAEDLAGFPDVRLFVLVHVVEGNQEIVENRVLEAIAPFIDIQADGFWHSTLQNRRDGPRRKHPAVGREMDSRGKDRIDEARRVADQHEARHPES